MANAIQYKERAIELQNSLKEESPVLPCEPSEDLESQVIRDEESMIEEEPQQQSVQNHTEQTQVQPEAAEGRTSQSTMNPGANGVNDQSGRVAKKETQQSTMDVENIAEFETQHQKTQDSLKLRQQEQQQIEKQTNRLQAAMQTKSTQLRNELKALREQVHAHNPKAVIENAKNEVLEKYRGLFTEIEKVKQVIAHNQKQTDEKQMLKLEEDEQARESETHTGVQTTRVVPLHPPEPEAKPQPEQKKEEKGFLGYFLGAVSIVAGFSFPECGFTL